MKKSLIALAVLGVSGAAMAQSSVTLYGAIDVGYGQVKSNGEKAQLHAGGDLITNTTSRIGFKGVEDLGGGTKVGFNFEQGINSETGASGGYQRQAHVWIGGGFGTLKLGRAFTPSYNGIANWEILGAPNYSVVANTYGYGGSGTSRHDSQISYATPNLGGFSAEVAYVTKHDNTQYVDKDKWDLNVAYANGPLAAAVTAAKIKDGKTSWTVGGKYNFGQFAVAASYNDAREIGALHRRGVSLGASAKFDAFSLAVDFTRDTKVSFGKKYTNGVVEAKYALSKRTFVYADYLRLDEHNNYGVGVRHNF
ncbi:MAG: porin [Burkholderiaceae bacterium]|nr:porin [Burkholderiaceae bacterium]